MRVQLPDGSVRTLDADGIRVEEVLVRLGVNPVEVIVTRNGTLKDNYFRTIYGALPIASGLMTQRQHLTYFAVTGLFALAAGLYLIWYTGFSTTTWVLLGFGMFFLLFYTWPLKYIELGEVAVLMVWGPLMIGGGYYVLAHKWDWNVVIASIPYVLGVTTVIFGKHIDKFRIDREKKIFTLPVVIGEKAARYSVLAMMILPYLFTAYLIATKFFTHRSYFFKTLELSLTLIVLLF